MSGKYFTSRLRAVVFLFGLSVLSTSAGANALLVLPVSGETEKSEVELAAVNRLFRDALETRHGNVIAASASAATAACGERACALEAAKAADLKKSDQVVYSSLQRLGAKWIFLSTIVRADGKKAYNQRMTVETIEDLEPVTQRMAEVLISRTAPEFAASIDDVTEREKTFERAKRKTPYSMGVGVGYLVPVNGGFNYLKEDNTNTSYPYTETDHSALLRLSWINTWEFRRDIHVGLEAVWTEPENFGGDLNLSYLLGGGDFAPFFGGGIGLHYVRGDEDPVYENKRNFGPAANGHAGLFLFRTYGMNVKVRGQYLAVFNDDRDQGFAIDVAMVFQ
jgi:hypothetical protein